MKLKRIVSTILCVVLLFPCVYVNAGIKTLADYMPLDTTNGEAVSKFYDTLVNDVIRNYRYELTRDELLTAAVKKILTEHPELLEEFGKGMFEALDENSSYYNEEEFEEVFTDVTGIYVGIGVNVYFDEDRVMLGELLEGSPATGLGLEVGDIVVAVDDERVEGYGLDKVTSLIRGIEGTEVKLTVLRNGKEYTYTIKRAKIKINPISYNVLDGTDIGYVKITSFNANTEEAIDVAMKDLHSKGVKKIVLDLRNNLGGQMSAALAVASYFIPDGKLICTEEYKDESKNKKHYGNKTDYKFKAVVLINKYSASASELVSGAIRDYGTGILVGQTSFGKGTVQTYVNLKSNDYLWITVAEYYTPSHNQIHKVGIEPDYIVTNKYKSFDMSTVTPYEITRVLRVGDKGDDVYAVKERLKVMGYNIELNDIYDEKTAEIVERFQASTELFPYGVADFTTQIRINDVLRESEVLEDKQYERSVNLAKNMK